MGVSRGLRFEVLKRDDFTCRYCGKKSPEAILEVDHVIPRSKKGADDPENLVTACYECNRGKGVSLLHTGLRHKDIRQETALLADREMRLAQYNQLRTKIRQRQATQTELLKRYFTEQFSRPQQAQEAFPEPITRRALKMMGYVDMMDWIDYAIAKTARDSRHDCHTVAAAKYLSGILRNKLKNTRDKHA